MFAAGAGRRGDRPAERIDQAQSPGPGPGRADQLHRAPKNAARTQSIPQGLSSITSQYELPPHAGHLRCGSVILVWPGAEGLKGDQAVHSETGRPPLGCTSTLSTRTLRARIGRFTSHRTARSGRRIDCVGSISHTGSQTRVVLDESPIPALDCRGTGDRHDVGTHHFTYGVAGTAPVKDSREPLRLRAEVEGTDHGPPGWWAVAAAAGPRRRAAGCAGGAGVRLGRIERVSYHLGDRGPTPGKLSCGGGVVRLGGYRPQHADTMDVLAAGQRVTLLVVPPETSAPTAHAGVMAAGHRGNTDKIETLTELG